MIDIVVAGEGALFADLLRSVLVDQGYEVALAPSDQAGLVAAVTARRPRTVLVDHLGDEDPDPAAMVRELCRAGGGAAVVVVSSDQRAASVDAALDGGARGYLHKSGGLDALLRALERVAAGEIVVHVPRLRATTRTDAADARRLAAALTSRERQCLALLVDGVSTPQITSRLGISTLTVRSHVQSILYKLGVHSRLEAASLAVRYDLLVPARAPSRAG